MTRPVRKWLEPIRLPIVEVEFAIKVWRDPRLRATLIGDRRHIVDMALRTLDEAKRDQIDGQVEVDGQDVQILLLAFGVTQAWMHDLLFFRLTDDE
jgi:hypothetical protein